MTAGRVAVVVFVWTLLWWVPLAVVLHPAVPGSRWILALLAVAALAPMPVFLRAFFQHRSPSAFRRVFVFRPFWYVQLFVPLAVLAALVGALVGVPFGASGAVARWTLAAAGGAIGVGVFIGYLDSRRLVVRPLALRFPQLPPGLEGLRIVQISDLHVGPHTPTAFLQRVADAVMAADPQLIVITGDQVDDYVEDVPFFARAFSHLTAPLGVFAIAGNHDIYAGWHGVRDGLEAAGFRVLVNGALPLDWRGSRFWLAATGDPAAGRNPRGNPEAPGPDIRRALDAVPQGAFVVALAHNPALWPALAERGVALTLSGHTHYGQFALPRLRWSAASVFLQHAMGVHREGDRLLYINPGTNYWGIPFRLGTPPEVTVITLRGS